VFTAEIAESAEMTERENPNRIRKSIIGAAVEVHRALGPGLLESAYQACPTFERAERGLKVERQKPYVKMQGAQKNSALRFLFLHRNRNID